MTRKFGMISRRAALIGSLFATALPRKAFPMGIKSYPPLSEELALQLSQIESADGIQYPCSVGTDDGSVLDRVYIAAAAPWYEQWGVWPEDDTGKQSLDIRKIVDIRESPSRLPVEYARKLYDEGESGMGYSIFTVVFQDGTRQAFATGNAVDFIDYPEGQSPTTVADVLPHVGRDDYSLRRGPKFSWSLFGEG